MVQDNPETACRLIEVAPSYHVREPSSIPEKGGNSVGDRSQQMLDDHKDNTGYEELASAVNQLDPDQPREVVAQRWLGRGDYTLEEGGGVVKQAKQQWSPETARYLIDHPLLADELQEGGERHGYCRQALNSRPPM